MSSKDRVKKYRFLQNKASSNNDDSEACGLYTDYIGISRRELFQVVRHKLTASSGDLFPIIEAYMSGKLQQEVCIDLSLYANLRKLLFSFKSRWRKCNYTEHGFLKKNEAWLQGFVPLSKKSTSNTAPTTSASVQHVSFQNASERTRRRRTEVMRNSRCSSEVLYAATLMLRKEGNFEAARISKMLQEGCIDFAPQAPAFPQFSAEQAVLKILHMTRNCYQDLRNDFVREGFKDTYPPYNIVLAEKKKCYPPDSVITGNSASVPLQSLLDHTMDRIALHQAEVLCSLPNDQLQNLTLYVKWGLDGSSGQRNYKMNLVDEKQRSIDDSSLFVTSIVPLQLETSKDTVVWKNPAPSSPFFCRPLHLQFITESTEVIKQEHERVLQEIQNMSTHVLQVGSKMATVIYNLSLTMVDGKVTNAITDTSSSMRCHLCGATSKDFNNVDACLLMDVNQDYLQYDMSSLHAWIRCYECLLNLSYKSSVKKWQVGEKHPQYAEVQERKKMIQEQFRQEMGLIIDKPKQGSGNTNDGNTARTFFRNAEKTAQITGISMELVHRFHVVLQAIAFGHEIHENKFHDYAVKTARLFTELYPWYNMPTSVHKVLLHGRDIISASALPIGAMSEEAQEAGNKFIRKFRTEFARTCSRIHNMEDVFQRLMVHSDPRITSLRRKKLHKQLHALSNDVMDMLVSPLKDVPEQDADEPVSDDSDLIMNASPYDSDDSSD